MSFRPFLKWFSSLALHAALFFVIGSIVFSAVLSNKQNLKDSLTSSGIYNSFVDSIINANVDESNQTLSSLPLQDQKVRDIVSKSFSPQILKTQTDTVIDNIYTWLNGESEKLAFQYDFTQSRATMNTALATYAADRVMALPECEESPQELNVFTIQCRPSNINAEFIRTQTLNDLEASELLKDTIITQDDLPRTADNITLDQKYAFVPTIYQLMRFCLPVSIALFTLLSVVYIYIRKPWQKGLRAYGKDLFSNGVMLIILTALFGYVIPKYTDSYGISGNETAALFNHASNTYIHKIDIVVINIAIQLAAVGLGLLLILRINRKTSMYAGIKSKAGIATSVGKSTNSTKRSSRPPVQTSEATLKPKTRKTTSVSKKYRGAKW